MTDNNAFERFVADHLAVDGSGTVQAERLAALIDERISERRQLPRLLASIKEPPMRTNSRVTVGDPTIRVIAVMAATLLLILAMAAAGVAGARLLAASGPFVVAQDGSGDFTTIGEAVAAAEDGDEVLVRPGTYAEVVVIDKDITLRGDGPREQIILEFDEEGPMIPSWSGQVPYGLMLVDTEAIVSDLTVRAPSAAVAFVLVGGAPTLERVANEWKSEYSGRTQLSVAPLHGAGATIRDSLLIGPVWHGDAGSLPEYADITGSGRFAIEDNASGGLWLGEVAAGSTILRNSIAGDVELSLRAGNVLVAENDMAAIELDEQMGDGVTIRDNAVHATGDIEAGIALGSGAPLVEGNTITGAQAAGIVVPEGASPTISGNQLVGLKVGISVFGAETGATIEGNRFCDNERDLVVPEGSSLALDPSNEVCVQAASE